MKQLILPLLLPKLWEWFRLNQQPLGAVVATLGIITFVWKLVPLIREKWHEHWVLKQLPNTLGANLYTPQEIFRATRYYVESDCQSVDPGGGEEFRQVFATRENSFKALDHLLFGDSQYRHTLILADSGMGKSSLLINYYARHIRSKRKNKHFKIIIIPLGIPNVSDEIAKYNDRSNMVLFLDALDEDTLAIVDYKKRLADLLQWTAGFRHVLITCRTQFFLSDEEIPKDVGIVRIGITKAGENHNYVLNKLYLSPFNDIQITSYLKTRFPIWHNKARIRAKQLIEQMGDLSVRPMLLAHIDELITSHNKFGYSYQIYEEMVEAWLTREEKFVPKKLLREFSELVAVNIYCNRKQRKSEKIAYSDLLQIANSVGSELAIWQDKNRSFLSNRSLLNRDAEGNRKFSHRSIMEYLFIARVTKCSERIVVTTWTDQMEKFWMEMLHEDLGYSTLSSIYLGTIRFILEKTIRDYHTGMPYYHTAQLLAVYPITAELDFVEVRGIFFFELLDFRWIVLKREDAKRRVSGEWILRSPTLGELFLIYLSTAYHQGYLISSEAFWAQAPDLGTTPQHIALFTSGFTQNVLQGNILQSLDQFKMFHQSSSFVWLIAESRPE